MNENELEVFQRRIVNNIKILENLGEYLGSYINSGRAFSGAEWVLSIYDELLESKSLILKYNSLGIKALSKIREIRIEDVKVLMNWRIDAVLMSLKSILRELREAKDYLDLYLKPNLSEVEKTKIDSLRTELEDLEKNDCNPLITKNLKEALSEVESNHYLAGAIISARIIDYILHHIKEREGLEDENLNMSILEVLNDKHIIPSGEKAQETKKFFLDASKSSRDAITHKLEYLPSASECFSILSYAFRMSDLLIKYEKIKDKGNENTNK